MTNRLTGGAGNDTLQATAFLDNFDGSGSALNILLAGDGNDSLTATMQAGTSGANRLYGHAGNDRLQVIGGSGNLLNAGSGTDILIAGAGTDTLVGGSRQRHLPLPDEAASTPAARDVLQGRRQHRRLRAARRPTRRPDRPLGDRRQHRGGVQHFVFGTSHGTGRLWAVDSGAADADPRQHRRGRRRRVRARHPRRQRARVGLHRRRLHPLTPRAALPSGCANPSPRARVVAYAACTDFIRSAHEENRIKLDTSKNPCASSALMIHWGGIGGEVGDGARTGTV